MIKLLEKNLAIIINSLFLFLILLCEAEDMLGLSPYYILLFGIINILLILFCSMKLRNRIIVAISLGMCLPITILVVQWENMVFFTQGFYGWLRGTPTEEGPAAGLYQLLFISLLSILCFCFQLLVEKLLFLRLLITAAVILRLCIDLFTAREMQHLAVVCAFGYIIITYIFLIQKRWKKHKNNPHRPYFMWIAPFLSCYMVLMLVMPAPEKPYDWQFAKNLYNQFMAFTQSLPLGGEESFQMAASGFSEDGKLLGNMVKTDQEVMLIQGKNNLRTNVYLTGKVHDTFYGNQWVQTNTLKERDRKLDALETLYAIWLYDEKQAQNYTQTTAINIMYLDFHTGYLFSPLKTWKVIGTDLPYSDEDGNLLLSNMRDYGTTYDSYYFQLNIDHPLFYRFLESSTDTDMEVWKKVLRQHSMAFEEKLTIADLEKHRENIHQIYSASYNLSSEAEAYLEQITADATTDIEKLRAIEVALSSMEYTLTPGALPDNITSPEAFLDYFLLESKRGFCSYFATAFTLLARAEGIPARYVEGFCVPIEDTQSTTVYGYMAHAWPEVYIDGIGWIPFEPTPGYAQIRYTPWEERDYTAHTYAGDSLAEEPEDDLEEELLSPSDVLSSMNAEQQRHILKIAGYTTLLIVTILALLFATDKYFAKKRYRKWSLEQRFHFEIQQNLQLLSLLGYQHFREETLEELQNRAWAVLHQETDSETLVLQFLTLYEQVLYGGLSVTEEILQQARTERVYLLEALKKWKYWAYLYYKSIHIL